MPLVLGRALPLAVQGAHDERPLDGLGRRRHRHLDLRRPVHTRSITGNLITGIFATLLALAAASAARDNDTNRHGPATRAGTR
ncbi:hypothetical protein ACFWSF_19210 [Streptomyces sp. NPDC058611]|uniref:hypothetical protein n=1 Tax=unclassified Streptomyces TaxID=2593676 RepID=UPI00366A2FFA